MYLAWRQTIVAERPIQHIGHLHWGAKRMKSLGDMDELASSKSLPKPSVLVRIFGWTIILILPLVIAELAAGVYYTAKDGHFLSVRDRLAKTPNAFVNAFNQDGNCRYADTLYPHPYLAHAHKYEPNSTCRMWVINHLGLFG